MHPLILNKSIIIQKQLILSTKTDIITCICHKSTLTAFIDLTFYQCSGIDCTWYIMPGTTFCIFVIRSSYNEVLTRGARTQSEYRQLHYGIHYLLKEDFQ